MAYKTCENCGCRVYAQGCVNCDEMEYISMQEDYVPPKMVAKKLQQYDIRCSLYEGYLNEPHAKCNRCGKEEWQHRI